MSVPSRIEPGAERPSPDATGARAHPGSKGDPTIERCSCGRFVMERWCGVYGIPGETHTREVCGPDNPPAEIAPIRAQLVSHLHPLQISAVQAWAIECALISAYNAGVSSTADEGARAPSPAQATTPEPEESTGGALLPEGETP